MKNKTNPKKMNDFSQSQLMVGQEHELCDFLTAIWYCFYVMSVIESIISFHFTYLGAIK